MQSASAQIILLMAFLGLSAAAMAAAKKSSRPELKLWYRQPAKNWENEALPMGNGRLGVMAFGGVEEDRYALNESTIWVGARGLGRNKDLSADIKAARALLFAGKDLEAQELLQNNVMAGQDPERYQPLGDLILRTQGGQTGDYRRELDLDTAVHTLSYTQAGVRYWRRSFVSASDDVIVVEVQADKPGKISLEMELKREENAGRHALGKDSLLLLGQAGDAGNPRGTRFAAQLLASPRGGTVAAGAESLKIDSANSVLILIAAATDYNLADPSRPKPGEFSAGLDAKLKALSARGFNSLLAAHLKAHQDLFRRVSLDLGTAAQPGLPTDQRLEAYKQGARDPALEALYFQLGRYLLISSSHNGPLPANLQGLWNDKLSPPWSADFHVNINLQMNYWPAEPGALGECALPLFGYLDAMRPAARENAKNLGCAGITTGHTLDAWGTSVLQGRTVWGLWVMGMAWCSQHYMEHYRYSGDMEFLEQRAWPFLKESAEFLLDWLVPDPRTGKLVSGPATSPENQYFDAERRKNDVSMGPAMDQEIAWDCFSNVLDAAALLGIKGAFVDKVAAAKAQLALPQIAADGRLMEWSQPWAETEPGHRHLSHLFAVHPGHQFSADASPDFFAAAKRSLEFRLKHGGGHTGWSRAWIINFWARFLNGEEAYSNFRLLLSKSTLPNLFDTHPPFQIDGNFGGSAGVMEMLLQSQNGVLQLLPALPNAWASGKVQGLRARGAYSVDIEWKEGKLVRAMIHSAKGGLLKLSYAGQALQQQMAVGQTFEFKPK